MDKKLEVIVVFFSLLVVVGAAIGATQLSFHQSLTVPTQQGIEAYLSDGTTLILEGSDQTGMWTWDGSNTRFSAVINVKNVGNVNCNVAITPTNLGSAWTFSTAGNLNNLAPQEMRAITLYATNPAATGGASTGDFTLTIAQV